MEVIDVCIETTNKLHIFSFLPVRMFCQLYLFVLWLYRVTQAKKAGLATKLHQQPHLHMLESFKFLLYFAY